MNGVYRSNASRDSLATIARRRPVTGLVEAYGNAGLRHIEKEFLRAACRVQRVMGPRHRILLACFPKSGSTWLRTILSELPGFTSAWITESTGRGEQELSAWRVARASFGNFVAQHHVRYNDDTRRLIDQFRVKPVVLVRDIFDSVVSLLDHVKFRWPEIPQAFVTQEWRDLPDDQIIDFLVDMAVPWYMDFYMSWTVCNNAVRLNYEELHADPVGTVAELLNRLGIDAGDGEVRDAIAAAEVRDSLRNRGIIGRGKDLTEAQRGRILKQASYYSSVDFGPIGLTSEMIASKAPDT